MDLNHEKVPIYARRLPLTRDGNLGNFLYRFVQRVAYTVDAGAFKKIAYICEMTHIENVTIPDLLHYTIT